MGLPEWRSALEGTRDGVEQQDDLAYHVITRATILLLVCAWQASYLLLRWPESMKKRNCLTTATRMPQQHQPLPSPPRHHCSRRARRSLRTGCSARCRDALALVVMGCLTLRLPTISSRSTTCRCVPEGRSTMKCLACSAKSTVYYVGTAIASAPLITRALAFARSVCISCRQTFLRTISMMPTRRWWSLCKTTCEFASLLAASTASARAFGQIAFVTRFARCRSRRATLLSSMPYCGTTGCAHTAKTAECRSAVARYTHAQGPYSSVSSPRNIGSERGET